MPVPFHIIEAPDNLGLSLSDRVVIGAFSKANAAGGGAGQSVTVAFTGLQLPPSYSVLVDPGQDAVWWISAKTQAGFTVNLNPRLAANTLAAGTINGIVIG